MVLCRGEENGKMGKRDTRKRGFCRPQRATVDHRGQRLQRELQRTVARRALERGGLLHAGRCSQKARSSSRRLQSPPPAFGPGGQNAGRVCGPVQRRPPGIESALQSQTCCWRPSLEFHEPQSRPPNGHKPNSSLHLPRRFDTQCAPIQLTIAHPQIVAWPPGRPLQSRNSLLYSFTVKLAFVTCVSGPQFRLTAAPLPTFTVTACVVVWAFSLHVFNVYLPGGTSLIV